MSDHDYVKCPNCNHPEHNLAAGTKCPMYQCDCLINYQQAIDLLVNKLYELGQLMKTVAEGLDFAQLLADNYLNPGNKP